MRRFGPIRKLPVGGLCGKVPPVRSGAIHFGGNAVFRSQYRLLCAGGIGARTAVHRRAAACASKDNDRQTARTGQVGRPVLRDETLTKRILLASADMGGTAAGGDSGWKIELNDQERGALGKALLERKARLIEHTGDTTQPRARQRAGLLELSAIAPVLRKLLRST